MAITINGSGTVTGISAGGLPDNIITNAEMADDSVGIADLSATGTASSSTFLRGDNAWAAAGGLDGVTTGSGNVTITVGNLIGASGHGVDFSATTDGPQVSHASEIFDDYEEGTWNVTFNGNVSGQSGADKGQYVKIGRIVHITGQVHLDSSGNTDNVEINNLPFTSGGSQGEGSGSQYPLAGSYELNHQSDTIGVRWYIAESTQTAKLIDMRDNIGYSQVPAFPNKYVFLTSTYFAEP